LENEINQSVQKIWVCGPPLLNESFDKDLEVVSKIINIDFKT
jgi:hypothetical protein